jgi:hypothetical protein
VRSDRLGDVARADRRRQLRLPLVLALTDCEQAHEGAAVPRDEDFGTTGGLLHAMTEVVAELVGADGDDVVGDLFGGRSLVRGSGAEGIRTPGLFAASEALCQLSYSPGKLVIGCPV